MRPKGIHGIKCEPSGREEVKRRSIKGRPFSKKLSHEKIPSDERTTLKKKTGDPKGEDTFSKEMKERNCTECIDKTSPHVVAFHIIKERNLGSFHQLFGNCSYQKFIGEEAWEKTKKEMKNPAQEKKEAKK